MRNDNTYARAIAYYVSDCISGRNDLTTEYRVTAKCLTNSIYGAASMSMNNNMSVFLKKVIYNDPATIVFWSDGTKTIVKAQPGDIFDPEKGLAMAIAKKACGNTGNYYNGFKKWLPKNKVGNEDIIYEPEKHEDTVKEDEHYE